VEEELRKNRTSSSACRTCCSLPAAPCNSGRFGYPPAGKNEKASSVKQFAIDSHVNFSSLSPSCRSNSAMSYQR